MSDIDAQQWLEQWVESNLDAHEHAERKSDMRDQAKACAEEARADGISIAELKEAADDDLETYLVRRQNAAYDRRSTLGSATSVVSQGAKSEDVIPVYEERLNVAKREVGQGAVKVRAHVVETPVNEQVSLRSDTASARLDRWAIFGPPSKVGA